jgi:hypothetical protein
MLHWLRENWLTIFPPIAILGVVVGIVKIVVTKKFSPPVLKFEALRDKGLTPSEVIYLVRIISEPLQGITSLVTKRRDIQQAKVRAQFKHNNAVVSEQFLDSEPDGLQSVSILANNSTYDFLLVSKSEGYANCHAKEYPTGDILPAKADISVLIAVIEGQHILGHSNYIIHNPDEHISSFSVERSLT